MSTNHLVVYSHHGLFLAFHAKETKDSWFCELSAISERGQTPPKGGVVSFCPFYAPTLVSKDVVQRSKIKYSAKEKHT